MRNESNIYEVPFEWGDTNPLILIQVSINGSRPAPFMFDTGSEATLILNTSYTKIRSSPAGRSVILNETATMEQIKPVKLVLKSAPTDFKATINTAYRTRLTILDEFYGQGKIAGILGGDVLHFFKVLIDFDAQKIKLGEDSTKEQMNLSGWGSARRLSLERGGPSKICPVVRLFPQGKNAEFGIIDTGANISVFTDELLKRYTTKKSRMTSTGADMLKSFEEQLFRVSDFALTGEKQPVLARLGNQARNFIGMDYLSRFNLYLDYTGQEMLLQPRKVPVLLRGNRGFSVVVSGRRVVVTAVHPDFNGSEPLLVGDELVLSPNLTLMQVQYLLDGFEGEEGMLTVRRNSAIRTIKYKRISMF
ncbi:MAG: hypothetical protein QM758_07545 [Armatimonas sp.]